MGEDYENGLRMDLRIKFGPTEIKYMFALLLFEQLYKKAVLEMSIKKVTQFAVEEHYEAFKFLLCYTTVE